jgi:hypothetical protein
VGLLKKWYLGMERRDKHAKQWFSDLPFSKLETYGILRDKNGYFGKFLGLTSPA